VIVEHRTYVVKQTVPERDVADFVNEVMKQVDFPNAHRVCVPMIGPFNTVVHDIEFKDLAERQAFWEAFFARPEIPDWVKKWNELVLSGGSTEIWSLVE